MSTLEPARALTEHEQRPPGSNDRWASAISEATEHVRHASADEDVARGRNRILTTLAGLVLAAVVALTIPRMSERPAASLPVADQARDLRVEAALLIEEIEAYWREHGTLPDPIVLTPFLDEGYEYEVIDASKGRFVVRRRAGGVVVAYDGSLPLNLWLLVGGQVSGETSS